MDKFNLVIRGNIVLPDEVLMGGYVAVSQGKIAAVDSGIPPLTETLLDARGHN
jgi:allantoinase